jgi:hypothetical protein
MNAVVKSGKLPAPASNAAALMEVISRAASDPQIDVEKMDRLLQMQERIVGRQAEADFNAAMTAAQSEMGPISADAHNPQTRSKYASYAKLDGVLRPIYTKHGFALSFDEGEAPVDSVLVLCHVSHSAGHSRTYKKLMPADGKGAKGGDVMTKTHAAGAAMSYGMRYLLKGIFNVAVGEDDRDGNDEMPRISESQAADLKALLEETGADQAAFMRWAKITSLSQILARNYDTVVKQVRAAGKARAK